MLFKGIVCSFDVNGKMSTEDLVNCNIGYFTLSNKGKGKKQIYFSYSSQSDNDS